EVLRVALPAPRGQPRGRAGDVGQGPLRTRGDGEALAGDDALGVAEDGRVAARRGRGEGRDVAEGRAAEGVDGGLDARAVGAVGGQGGGGGVGRGGDDDADGDAELGRGGRGGDPGVRRVFAGGVCGDDGRGARAEDGGAAQLGPRG